MGRSLWLLVLLCWPLTGWCASPVPTELYAEVDHALRTEVVLADPIGYHGRTLLLGGKVERTLSEPGRVTVQLVGYRLDDDDRPLIPGPDLGRLVVSDVQVDGARLQPGRLVTVVGRVVGWGESDGRVLPRLASRFIHAWPTPEEEAAARCRPGACCDPWCDPWWHDPWCDPWYYGPHPRWYWGGGYYRYRR
jgi:starvation-inducible outer membrane lipoprotein